MSFQPLETYEVLKKHKSDSYELVSWHFSEILKSINRKITLKKKLTEPFLCTVVREIHVNIFYQIFRAIRDYKITFGTETSELRNSKKQVTSYSVKFSHFGAFRYHLGQLSGKEKEEVVTLLKKTFPTGGNGNVVVSEEKPVILTYKVSTLVLKCHFETVNRYGHVTSF